MSGGYGWIQEAIDGKLALQLMLILCFGKILATSFTISSGGSGGVFAPSLYIGAMLGGAFGLACQRMFPGDHYPARGVRPRRDGRFLRRALLACRSRRC